MAAQPSRSRTAWSATARWPRTSPRRRSCRSGAAGAATSRSAAACARGCSGSSTTAESTRCAATSSTTAAARAPRGSKSCRRPRTAPTSKPRGARRYDVMIVDHDRDMDEIGAYLLGALSADEVDVLERHLEICQECRRELARLRTAADALPRAVEPIEPPPALKRELMREIRGET